jgi:hypothetical protein
MCNQHQWLIIISSVVLPELVLKNAKRQAPWKILQLSTVSCQPTANLQSNHGTRTNHCTCNGKSGTARVNADTTAWWKGKMKGQSLAYRLLSITASGRWSVLLCFRYFIAATNWSSHFFTPTVKLDLTKILCFLFTFLYTSVPSFTGTFICRSLCFHSCCAIQRVVIVFPIALL